MSSKWFLIRTTNTSTGYNEGHVIYARKSEREGYYTVFDGDDRPYNQSLQYSDEEMYGNFETLRTESGRLVYANPEENKRLHELEKILSRRLD